MAETKAEDEDDEWGFGDFTFAAPVSIHTDKNNTNKDDDEWGDFVESPLQSATALSPNQSSPSKNFSGFSVSSDGNQQGGVGSEGKNIRWVKLKGALPLSLFGEEEEVEEGSGAVDLSAGDGKGSFFDGKRNGYLKNESNSHSAVGINDIITNLYSQNHQIKDEENGVNSSPNVNETRSDSSATTLDSRMNRRDLDSYANFGGLKLEFDGSNSDLNGTNSVSRLVMNRRDLDSYANFGGLKFEFDGSNSDLNGTNSVSSLVNFDIDSSTMNMSGLNLTAGNSNTDIHTSVSNQNQEIKVVKGLISNSNRLNAYSDVSSSNFGGWDSNVAGVSSNAEPVTVNEELDDDDGWEFKDAYSESMVENRRSDKGNVALEFPAFHMQTESKIGQEMQEFPEVAKFSSEFGKGSQGQNDLFAVSNGVSSKSHGMNIDFDFNPGLVSQNGFTSDSYWQTVQKDLKNGLNSHPLAEKAASNETNGKFDLFAMSNGFTSKSQDTDVEFNFITGMVPQNGFILDSYLQSEQNDMKNGLDSHSLTENSDFDETFGDFEAAVLDTASKQEQPKVNGPSPADGEALIFNGRNQGNEMKSENCNGPMPLSIFGEEELETDTSLNIQDVFMSKQAPHSENVHSWDPSLSISDLLSNLYNQADSTRVDSMHKPTENGLVSTNRVSSSDLLDGGDDFEDDSWEFKDAVSQVRTNSETSLHSIDDGDQNFSTKSKLNTSVDFYCKLKDELCLVSSCHLDSLKKARSTAALSGEVGKLAAFDEEIQDACKELDQENIMYKKVDEEDHTPREISLKEFLEALHELKFQVLDEEFELSRKLPLAEKDLKSAIELIKHATSIMKILTLVSTEEQHSYVSTWLKMISICTQELKHGAWIWKHSLDNNINNQILSEPQGKRLILALGEIFRVVLVLGASVRRYKTWILSSSVNLASIYALLEECHSLWSSSGLEEAIQSISDLSGSEYYGTVDALLASIKRIRDTDAFALESRVFGQQESVCLLSGLTPELVPDMKMVVWNGEHYFLPLANLWANLISCDPPKLQRLKVG